MTAVVVTGMGWVSALGSGVEVQWQRLLRGETAIAVGQPFPELPPRPLGLVADQPQKLQDLLVRATQAALQDAKLAAPLPETGVVIGSSRGPQAQWEAFARGQPITHWLETLPAAGAIAVARQIHTEGPVLAPMAACATGLWAIAQGAELIRRGQCDRVLVGAGEAAITPLTLAGFEQMRALASTGCYPFDQRREGLVLGEGAAVLILERDSVAQARNAPAYGTILGAGLTADARHISAPTLTTGSGLRAIHTSLQRSGLPLEAIGLIHAHGTGTQLNDAYETALIQKSFPHPVPITATKGATGHTLGASGAMGAVVCLLALHHQLLPPCAGLETPAFDLNFLRQPQATPLAAALCFSFGFGGQNAVLAFGKGA
ncbi:beta-ketoacyl-ACP synthase [Leptolyngbya sp. PCC 6406]|uniref:beta-ketoacyl-ACP synthase n=1 Tax=Leptolyngbya sp. PCC 6406 TaxID=1173264 RepID=UPI0002ABE808|nr:beta-ketoacyl-ACP synthase [Leptolyngbya sp. PCC 6406]